MQNGLNSKDVPNPNDPVDRSVVNWLSQVIAGKRPPLPPGVGGTEEDPAQNGDEAEIAARNAAVVDTLRRLFSQRLGSAQPEPIPEPAEHNSSAPGATAETPSEALPDGSSTKEFSAAQFTAEDLCGTAAVPLIVASPSDEITAADICWVPPGHELHPEPPAAEPAIPESALPPSEPPAPVAAAAEAALEAAPETVEETAAEITAEAAPAPSAESPSEPPQAEAAPALEEQPSIAAEPAEPPAAGIESAQSAGEAASEPLQKETAEEQATISAETAGQLATATESAEPQPPESATESQPESAPQEVSAAPPESIFADGAIWRAATEMAAAQNGGIPHASAEASTRQEEADSIQEGEPFRLVPLEPTEASTAPSENWLEAMKALMRLNPVMPWLAEGAKSGRGGESTTSSEIRDQVAGIRLVQYETRTSVQDQAVQLKRMEENLARVREALQSTADRNLAETVKTTARTVRMALIGTGITLALVLIIVGMLLAHGR